ncbi:MAG TPA: DUF6531 domain-containing protein, partial [Herpetosiphonaceae bacterium]
MSVFHRFRRVRRLLQGALILFVTLTSALPPSRAEAAAPSLSGRLAAAIPAAPIPTVPRSGMAPGPQTTPPATLAPILAPDVPADPGERPPLQRPQAQPAPSCPLSGAVAPSTAAEMASAMGISLNAGANESAQFLDLAGNAIPANDTPLEAGVVHNITLGTYFPLQGGTFPLVSTGDARAAACPQGESGSDGGQYFSGIQLELKLRAPSNATCAEIPFRYFTDDRERYLPDHNDRVTFTADGEPFALDTENNPVSSNSVLDFVDDTDSVYWRATHLLKAQTPVVGGNLITFKIRIEDIGTGGSWRVYDSAIFFDQFTWRSSGPCHRAVVPPLPGSQNRNPEDCDCNVQAQRGEPINTRTGNLWTEATDLVVRTPGLDLAWSRTYNSQSITEVTTPMGPGWQHRYGARLIFPASPGGEPNTLMVLSPEGNLHRFTIEPSGLFTPWPGVSSTIAQNGSAYVQTLRSRETRTFDATGRLSQITDPNGRQIALNYNPDGTLDKVQDGTTAALYLQLGYSAGRLSSVTDGLRTVQYRYTPAGDLHEVEVPAGRIMTYSYQSHLLTAVQNHLGDYIEQNTYDAYTAQGKAVEQILQDGRTLTLDYQADKTIVTTTAPGGAVSVEEFAYSLSDTLTSTKLNDQLVSTIGANDHFAIGKRVDGNGNTTRIETTATGLPTQITYADGSVETMTYNAANQPLSRTDAYGRTTTSVYDADGDLTSHTTDITDDDPQGKQTIYTYHPTIPHRVQTITAPDGTVITFNQYDARGNVLQQTTVTPEGIQRVEDFLYNTRDQRTRHAVTVNAETPRVTTYTYDALGYPETTTTLLGTALQRIDRTTYLPDGRLRQRIDNYQDGSFNPNDPDLADEDVTTTYGYDGAGRPSWVRDTLGRYTVTHYNAKGQIDWQTANLVPATLDGQGNLIVPATPPAFDPQHPDRNVTTSLTYDTLGRQTLETRNGILAGAFDPEDGTFASATTRTTRTEYDALHRPYIVTENYQPGQPVDQLADVNVRT